MTAVWLASWAQLRRRWVPTLALILLVGLAGGVVVAAVAGASRTESAMRRFVAFSRPEDVYVSINGPGGDPSQPGVVERILADRARLPTLPEVAEVARAPYLLLSPDKSGQQLGAITLFGAADGHAFRTIDRPAVLSGRFARLDNPDEVIVDDTTAGQRHLHVGSRVTLWSYSAEQNIDSFSSGLTRAPAPEGAAYTVTVVGIVREASAVNAPPPSIVADAEFESQGGMVLTPAFLDRLARDQGVPVEALPAMEGFRVRLRHGSADVPAFRQSVQSLARPEDLHVGSDIQSAADKVQQAFHLEAIALVMFAAVAGAAALVIVGQALARQVAGDTTVNPTLAALGMSRRQLVVVPLVRAGLVAAAGGAVAVAVAVALSPLTPIGLARRAEIHPGVSVNVAILALGFVGVASLTLLRAGVSAWKVTTRLRSQEQAPARPGSLTAAVARSGLGPSAVAGVGMSFERGRGVAFRTSLLAALLAVTGLVAAVTVGVSLHHLVDDYREQGWNWDVVVGNPNSRDTYSGDPNGDSVHNQMVWLLAANDNVGAFSGFGLADEITVDGRPVDLAGIEATKGSVLSTMVEGRPPASPDEIVLGRDTLRQIHRHVGQTVTARAREQSVTLRIVGVSLQATAGDLATRLSSGGAVTLEGLRRLAPDTPVFQFSVRFRPGVDREAATRSLVNDFGRQVLRPFPGGEVGDLARVDFLPYLLAVLLVVLAVGALALTLLASVRRHRRDLAVLKTIGFVPRQVSATVAWQATTLAVGALVFGVPLGMAIGRWTWHLVASGLGSVSPPIVPMTAVLVVIPATLLVANVLAAGPGWLAGRVRPAEALRAE